MKKINKKGFTLVEIIITLAIVITITTVAVGSYIGISKNKKKEEWALVKKQIETAAEQYISTNKYMYEDLDSNGLSAYISVGTLVETDYLNKVVDPKTKKELDKCALVEVKISSSGKYTATYIGKTDDDTNCSNTNKSIVFKEAKAADIEVNVSKLNNTHDNIGDWYDTGAKYTLNIKSRKKSVTNVKYCIGNSSCSPDTDISSDYSVTHTAPSGEDEKYKYACFMVTAMSGGTAKRSKACNYANIDNSNPTCTAKFTNANSYGWTNNTAVVNPNTCSDTGIGCSSISGIENRYSKETSGTAVSVKVKDRFGHEGTCSTTVKVDKTDPSGSISITSSESKYNSKNTKLNLEASDSLSGVESAIIGNTNYFDGSIGTSKWKKEKSYTFSNASYDGSEKSLSIKIYDVAGNSATKSDTYTLYKECTKNNITYKNGKTCTKTCGGGTLNQLAYDKNNSARCSSYDKTSGGSRCNTQSCGASSCTAVKVLGQKKDCRSGAGNDVTAQLKIVCNGKIDYINLQYYYPGVKNCKNSSRNPAGRHYPGNSSNSSNDLEKGTHKNGSNINGAVFNLLGCSAKRVTYRYQVAADGKVIADWSDWITFDFSNKNDADEKKTICKPDKGAAWFK